MHNRWQAHKGAACGEVAPIIMCLEVAQHCSTSSTPNDSEVSAPRRLRYRSTSGYAWFAISDGTSSRRSPLQHRIVLRRSTARTTARAGADAADEVIRVLSGRHYQGTAVVRGLRFAHPRLSPRCRSVRVLHGRLMCCESNMGVSSTDSFNFSFSWVCNRAAVVGGGGAFCLPHIVACGANAGLLKM